MLIENPIEIFIRGNFFYFYKKPYKKDYKKMTIKIEEKKIRKMGEFHYVSIPKALIDTNVLSTDKEYTILLRESNVKRNLTNQEKLKNKIGAVLDQGE